MDGDYPETALLHWHISSFRSIIKNYILQQCVKGDANGWYAPECRIRDGVKGIHLTTDRLGRPSGRAFIEMEHEDDVGKALEKHRQYLGPRYVEGYKYKQFPHLTYLNLLKPCICVFVFVVYEVTNNDAEAILKTAAEAVPSDWVVRLRGIPFSSSEADIVQFLSGKQKLAAKNMHVWCKRFFFLLYY